MTRRRRFVTPTTTRLDLSDGDWIEIKTRLDFGERQALNAATLNQSGNLADGERPDIRLDLAAYKVERMIAYLVDWSFCGDDGRLVPVSRTAITALEPETADEIDAALDAHLADQRLDPTPLSEIGASR